MKDIINIPSTPREVFEATQGKCPNLLLTAKRGCHKFYSFQLSPRHPVAYAGEFSAPGVGVLVQHLIGFSN